MPMNMGGQAKGVEGFERVFDLVGGNGLFQWRLLFIVSLQLIVLTWHHIGYAFLGSVPDHWCSIDELKESNWTLEQIKLISIPRKPDSGETTRSVFEQCKQYHLNYGSLVDSSFEEAYAKVDFENVSTIGCTKWDYDRSIYRSTVATEFDLVCDNRWMAATIQASYMAGGLVGTLSFGSMSDRFLGRRRTVLISLSIVVVAGILASFATSYWMFLLFRFFISIGVSGSMQNCFVLITEHADKSGRALFGIIEQVPFAVGYMMLPGLAYYLRDWNTLQLSFGLLSTGLFVYYWILPESPRWLATHGKTEKAINCLYKIAKVNKLPKPKHDDLVQIIRTCHDETELKRRYSLIVTGDQKAGTSLGINNSDVDDVGNKEQGSSQPGASQNNFSAFVQTLRKWLKGFVKNFKNLMKTAEIRKRSFVFWTIFMIVAMVYYGIVFSGNLTSDPYLLIFLGGLMEVPAYTVIVPFVAKLGRRPTTVGNFMLTGICMLGLAYAPNVTRYFTLTEYQYVRIVLAMLAKLFVSSGFAIVYLLGAELYPTELRTTGLAVGIFMGRIGAISAPYIVDLMQTVYKDLPTLIFGIVAVLGGFVSLMLPETKTLEMSDKVFEIELQAEEVKAKERERRQSWMEPA
ncbi:Solute carrier family 22 member 3 [Orchesella cincta]|uniref:Solute carrier family 22 member 3 n=1 Tax=Orchesella cincta TaxID=48709 RepID=A0A1D2MJL7_ORCCI|nr:Solute carrier family 22 member 3 [Orchesella cincta]